MSADEIGCYMLLLMYEWLDGPLPLDDTDLIRLGRLDQGCQDPSNALAMVKQCFSKTSVGYINDKLEVVRQEQIDKHNKRVEAGKKGGSASKQKGYSKQAMLKQSSSNAKAKPKQSDIDTDTDSDLENNDIYIPDSLIQKIQRSTGSLIALSSIEAAVNKYGEDTLSAAVDKSIETGSVKPWKYILTICENGLQPKPVKKEKKSVNDFEAQPL